MSSIKFTNWTPVLDDWLKELWGSGSMEAIAREMNLTPRRVKTRALKLGLPTPRLARTYEPTKQDWIEIATAHADAARLNRVKLLAGTRTRPYTDARWRAWRDLMARHPHVSFAGAGRISGFHHTSVISGVRRLAAMGAA